MNLDKIKLDIVKLIKRKKNVTLVDIENYFNEIGFIAVIIQYVDIMKT